MSTIETRRSADGITGYRAKVRLRGFPSQLATFERKTDAKKMVYHQKREHNEKINKNKPILFYPSC
jgi:hypothetical protein